MTTRSLCTTAMALVAFAGIAAAAPVIDGKITAGDNYGSPLGNPANPSGWLQNKPTARDNQPVLSVGNPEAVATGIELAIPLAAIGNPAGSIRVMAMVTSGSYDNVSNQIIPSVPLNTPNLGSPTTLDFGGSITSNNTVYPLTGNQWVLITPSSVATAPTMDGTREAAIYGTLAATSSRVQKNYTGYGDATHGNLVGRAGGPGADGSEIDSISAVKNGGYLYVFIGGNIEDNYNKLCLFIDTVAGTGQNQLSGLPAEVANLNGLKFDTGFDADYLIVPNLGPATSATTGSAYVDFVTIPTAGGGTFTYLGSNDFTGAGVLAGGTLPPGSTDNVMLSMNNSNIAGVVGQPVNGSVGDRDRSSGSEIDAVYGKIENGRMYLLVTGNIESSYQKLDLFFDVGSGGQNRLRGKSNALVNYRGNVDVDFSAITNMGSSDAEISANPDNPADGLKFESDFAADYYIGVTNGGDPLQVYTNAALLRTTGRREDFNFASGDYGAYDGGAKSSVDANNVKIFDPMTFSLAATPRLDTSPTALGELGANYGPRNLSNQIDPTVGPPYSPTPVVGLISMAIDNSNLGGVTLLTANPTAVAAVTTGVELSIDLAELGWDNVSPIKIAGFINVGNHDNISQQVIGGLPGSQGALGNPRLTDLSLIDGYQYVIIPAPSTPTGCNIADITGIGGPPSTPDGLLTGDDFNAFISAFASSDLLADVCGIGGPPSAPDGLITGDDFNAFIAAFASGCP